jgi:hypothetical protein
MPEVKQGYWEKRGYWLINTHLFPDQNYGWRYPDGTIHKDLPSIQNDPDLVLDIGREVDKPIVDDDYADFYDGYSW